MNVVNGNSFSIKMSLFVLYCVCGYLEQHPFLQEREKETMGQLYYYYYYDYAPSTAFSIIGCSGGADN